MAERKATVERNTAETRITVSIDLSVFHPLLRELSEKRFGVAGQVDPGRG